MSAPASGTGTPGQAAYEEPPLVYDRWCHVDDPEITEDELAGMWNGESPAEREFWRSLVPRELTAAAAAAQTAPGELAVIASRLGYALAALDVIVLYHGDGALGIAKKALGDDKAIREGAVVLHEQPAPELAADADPETLADTRIQVGVLQEKLAAAAAERDRYRQALEQVARMAEAPGAARQTGNLAKIARRALEGQ